MTSHHLWVCSFPISAAYLGWGGEAQPFGWNRKPTKKRQQKPITAVREADFSIPISVVLPHPVPSPSGSSSTSSPPPFPSPRLAQIERREQNTSSVAAGSATRNLPAEVVEVSTFLHECEGDAVTKLTNEKVPYFNAPIYLQNKTQIGKADEIFDPINESVSAFSLCLALLLLNSVRRCYMLADLGG
ncbi:hypothetical protein ACP70R_016027 [Stipagrostis hirtigluma subsp. patula]